MIPHRGGCFCGKITFEFFAPKQIEVLDCNCSICSRSRYLHLIVPHENFRLLCGESESESYQFGTLTAKHYFCPNCGVKSFYQPRSHPDSYSVNLRCVDSSNFETVTSTIFDGRNWEKAKDVLDA
ncbi:MAG: GFA family protein [Pseudomonadota bacterium]